MIRRLAAECLGTALLVCTVVGSGIMGEALSGGNNAVALLGNTIATGAILYVLITMFGPLSGAHFNPVVSLVMTLLGDMTAKMALAYSAVQMAGGIIGTWVAHLMFELPLFQLSETMRTGTAQYGSEVVASFGLLLVILLGRHFRPEQVASLVGFYITAGYWFTASTSFANPAVTIARTLSDSFAGIHYGDTVPFIIAQITGGIIALFVAKFFLFGPQSD